MRKEEKMAYIAGLIDGDGSISLIKRSDKKCLSPLYYPSIQLSKSTPLLADFLHESFGGYKQHVQRDAKKPEYKWRLERVSNVMPLLENITPYLCAKKRQAELIIEYAKKWNPSSGSRPIDGEVLFYRESVHQKIKQLNAKRDMKEQITASKEVKMVPYFWAYLAGLIDTDGSFSIKKEKTGAYSASILLSLMNVNPLSLIQKNCKYGSVFLVKSPQTKQKFYYRFGVYNRKKAIEVIKKLLPYLMHKREQALILLKFCEGYVAQNGLYKKTEEQQVFREKCYQELIKLNYGVYKPSLMDLKPLPGSAGGDKAEAGVKLGTVNVVSERAPLKDGDAEL